MTDENEQLERQRKLDRERGRRYRERHPERVKKLSAARQKTMRSRRPEEIREYQRIKQKEHRDRDANVDVWELLQNKADSFWKNVPVADEDECWEWQGSYAAAKGKKKYGLFYVAPRKKIIASRASYMLAHGPIPEGQYVCHKCDYPPCVNPNHLFAGTPKENCVDKVQKGRVTPRCGEKINAEIAKKILDDDRPKSQIAREYGISRALVHKIKSGDVWARIHKT